MPESSPMMFDAPGLHAQLENLGESEFDALEFGVIGFDELENVDRYNATESRLAGISRERVIGHGLFAVVAPCMNNYLVAQRLQDAFAAREVLDVTIDYVLTLRMRPRKVKLRLLASPEFARRYVVVQRQAV